MGGRIVVFGASGYTGRLTARALVARGERPVLAGRSLQRLQPLADALGGLETAVADARSPAGVRALVGGGDVLVSTVGPFARWGEPAVSAAIAAGAHYLDSAGESAFIRSVFERFGPRAREAGCALVPAFGYDWVPGNLAGALALSRAGAAATRVEIGYFAPGAEAGAAVSGGTRASAAGVMLEPAYAWRAGRLVTERPAARLRRFEAAPGRFTSAVSMGSSEHFALPRIAPGLRDVGVYVGWFGALSRPLQAASLIASALARAPGVKGSLQGLAARLVRGSTGGPAPEARRRTGSLVIAEAFDRDGRLLGEAHLTGPNPYDVTAALLAWGARAAANGGIAPAGGAFGPVDAFGLQALEIGASEAGCSVR